MNQSPCAYIKAPSSYYIVLREGWVFLLQLRWAHQRCRGRCISWGIKVFSSSYREEERALSCSKGSHRAELTGRKWKQERLASITGRKRVKGVEDSSTLVPRFHRALTHTAVEQIHRSTPLLEFEIEHVEEWMREGWRGKGPPAVSMQRGNWSSFWGKTLLLLWCARGLTVEIGPLLNKSRRRAESVIRWACFYNE